MHTANARTNRTKIGRWLGAATAALMFTLLLSGLTARQARADTMDEPAARANQFIAWCFRAGGDPEIHQGTLTYSVACYFPGGAAIYCDYTGAGTPISCNYRPPIRTQKPIGDQLGGEGGVATSDPSAGAGIADGQNGGMSAKTAHAGGNDQPAAHQHGRRHGAKPKPGKAASHQKSHAAKK
jgi:hypothetical protein